MDLEKQTGLKKRINNITIITREGTKTYKIGERVLGQKIERIEDTSWYEDPTTHLEHTVYDDKGRELVGIYNCESVVEFEYREDEK